MAQTEPVRTTAAAPASGRRGWGGLAAPWVGGSAGQHGQDRWTAPCRSAASATAASRAAPVSASVSVRSGARKRSANASDRLPSPICGAGVDVEQPHRLQQLARRPRAASAASAAAGTVGVDDQGDVLLGDRVRREALGACTAAGACAISSVEVDLDRAGAGGHAVRRHTGGVQLAGVPEPDTADRGARAQRPGCQGARVACTTSTSTCRTRASLADHLDGVGPDGRAARAPPAGRLALTGEHHAEGQRLRAGPRPSACRARPSSGRQSTPRIGALSRSGVGKNTGAVS